jgi:hypothetical protein
VLCYLLALWQGKFLPVIWPGKYLRRYKPALNVFSLFDCRPPVNVSMHMDWHNALSNIVAAFYCVWVIFSLSSLHCCFCSPSWFSLISLVSTINRSTLRVSQQVCRLFHDIWGFRVSFLCIRVSWNASYRIQKMYFNFDQSFENLVL